MCSKIHPAHPDWGPCLSGIENHPTHHFVGPHGEEAILQNDDFVDVHQKTRVERNESLREVKTAVRDNRRELRAERRSMSQQPGGGVEGLGLQNSTAVRRDARPTEIEAAIAAYPRSGSQKAGWILLAAAWGDYGVTADDAVHILGIADNTVWGRRREVSELRPEDEGPPEGWSGPYLHEDGRQRPRRSNGGACEVSVLSDWGRTRMIEEGLLVNTEGIVLSELGRQQCRDYGIPLSSPAAPPAVPDGSRRLMAL